MFARIFLAGILPFIAVTAPAQAREWYYSQSNNGLCDASIVLFEGGLYNIEKGCEASSHFCFGKWSRRNDTIIFSPIDPKTYPVIKKVNSKQTTDTLLTIKIVDLDGVNITTQMQPRQFVKGKGFYRFKIDTTTSIGTDLRRDSSVIRLTWLERLFKKEIVIPVIPGANFYEITLDISATWTFKEQSVWNNLPEFRMLKTKKGLVSVKPDNADENGNLVRTVYLLQK